MSAQILMDECLTFKADFVPMTIIKLSGTDLKSIKSQLSATTVSAPNYFRNAAVVIDVADIETPASTIDFERICQLLRDQHMIPVGVRGLDKQDQNAALTQGLAIIQSTKKTEKKPTASLITKTKETEPSTTNDPVKTPQSQTTTKMVTQPVRSGTQVYAKSGDLVIISAVNAGGECFADGNIHVYGPLRGKALAGVTGNVAARIFCESLEAELISIAGHYLTKENITIPKTKHSMIQIYLKNGKIQIDCI